MYSPLEQFIILIILCVNNQLTLLFLQYFFILFIFIFPFLFNFFFLATYNKSVYYEYFNVKKLFVVYNSGLSGNVYLSFFIFLGVLLFFFNTTGILPQGFTPTSHISLTLFLSFSYFFSINLICFFRYSFSYIQLFFPSGTPKMIVPLVFVIELISYYSRVLSLAIRIFANLMSGHILLHILVFFLLLNLLTNILIYIVIYIPITCFFLIIFMEILICYLQIYVFVSLSNLYLLDTYNVGNH